MKSDPKHDVLGQPFMFLLDNFYNDLGTKLNMRIELLHVIDHMIYTQQHQNPDIAKQISILYGPSWLSYQKNIRIEFRNGYFSITKLKDQNSKNVHIFVTPNPLVRQIFDNIFSITVFISTRWSNRFFKLKNNDSFLSSRK